MKKVISAVFLIAVTMILCCCSPNEAREEAHPTPEQQQEVKTDKAVLTMAVEKDLSENAYEAVRCFAEKVEVVSDGSMTVEILSCEDLLNNIDAGCDLAFGTNDEFARANGDFLIYSSPFYFADYNHLTMTLNSNQFNVITKNSSANLIKATPIGAFYDGAYYIISSREEMYDTLDQYKGKMINTVGAQPLFEEILSSLGADCRERDEQYLLDNFGKNRNISAIECKTDMLGQITKREKVERFHICKSFHRADINWLMLSEKARNTLNAYQMAVITEATAYAIAKNDGAVLEREEQSIKAAQQMGGMMTALNQMEFSNHAEMTLKSSNKYGSLWDWLVYEEVQNIAFEK